MKHYIQKLMILALMASTFATTGIAQAQAPKEPIPVRVQVVLSRFESEKKVSSLPYTLAVTANQGRGGGSLRMGSQIPVPRANGEFSMQNVGTNIDCTVTSVDNSRFQVELSISDSSVMERRSSDIAPTLRTFVTNNVVLLRDGQSAQFTAATDKNTGEVVKVDVTLIVEK